MIRYAFYIQEDDLKFLESQGMVSEQIRQAIKEFIDNKKKLMVSKSKSK